MIGIIDIGNTLIHAAIGKGFEIKESLFTNKIKELKGFFENIKDILIISVRPSVENDIKEQLGKRNYIDFPLNLLNYNYIGTPGEDRLANGLAVSYFYKIPSIVIDAGSAITIDFFDKGPSFRGGAILSGLRWYLDSLNRAELINIEDIKHIEKPGNSTRESILFGLCLYVEGIKNQVVKFKQPVVVTGGNGVYFMKKGWNYDPLLTLKGGIVAYNTLRR